MSCCPVSVGRFELLTGLRGLGLKAGDGLMVHSSLSSFGHVEGGAPTVIAALQEVLTEAGTLLMPTFNHGQPFWGGGPGYYSPTETPTSNGIIPDTLWRMPGVWRSLNPTHPFAAWGRHAQRYVENHHQTLTMGPESPLGLLLADDGYCLLMGVDYLCNTFHHVVETCTGAPCLGRRTEIYPVVLPDGRCVQLRTWGFRERACPLTDENRYADVMQARGLQREARVGPSRWISFRLRDCFDVIAEILRRGRDSFPPCSRCSIRPRRVEQTVESDWAPEDATTGRGLGGECDAW